jgi:glycosyltransferase involved in cell wall biosynthesis
VSRQRLLYCSPVMPAVAGNGLAMRAGIVLRALATRYRVSLLIVPLYSSPAATLPDEIAACCEQVVVAQESTPVPGPARVVSSPAGRLATSLPRPWWRASVNAPHTFRDEPFDVVHVFRLALVERVRAWLDGGRPQPARHLDLDDVESVTRRRIADLHEQHGQPDLAAVERAAANRAERDEAAALRDFDRVYVCSEGDRALLHSRRADGGQGEIAVLPNALSVPPALPAPPRDVPFTFLFVGTLGYYPNEDAIDSFCRETLPRLRRMAPRPFRVNVAGYGASPAVEALASIPEVTILGAVPSIDACYARAHAVVVPVRAGGGTRIKILEAFAFRRPVVTTTVGAEGIAAEPDRHVVIADDPGAFARHCARLIASPELGGRLVEQAHGLCLERYSIEALVARVHSLA